MPKRAYGAFHLPGLIFAILGLVLLGSNCVPKESSKGLFCKVNSDCWGGFGCKKEDGREYGFCGGPPNGFDYPPTETTTDAATGPEPDVTGPEQALEFDDTPPPIDDTPDTIGRWQRCTTGTDCRQPGLPSCLKVGDDSICLPRMFTNRKFCPNYTNNECDNGDVCVSVGGIGFCFPHCLQDQKCHDTTRSCCDSTTAKAKYCPPPLLNMCLQP